MKNLLKKTLCLVLTIGMLASLFCAAAGASELPDVVFKEDFEGGTDGSDVNGWNGWSNTSTSNSSGTLDMGYKILQESGNKVGNLTRTNCDKDTSKGYNSVKEITNETGRYVSWKFRARSDNANTGALTLKLYDSNSNSLSLIQYFNNSRLFFGSSNVYVNGGSSALTVGQWYSYEVYLDLTDGEVSLYVNNVKRFDKISHSLTGISKIQIESDRTGGATVPTGHDGKSVIADIKIDDILIENITDTEYNDAIEALPDSTYVFRETFNRTTLDSTVGSSGYNGWTLNNPSLTVGKLKFVSDPTDSSNTVLAFQRTGVPSGTQQFVRDITDIESGYVRLGFKILSANEKDCKFAVKFIDSDEKIWDVAFDFKLGTITIGYADAADGSKRNLTTYFNADKTVTRNKWYNVEIVLDLTANDYGYMSVYIDNRRVADYLKSVSTSIDSSGCYNNSTISKVRLEHNRTDGSTDTLSTVSGSKADTAFYTDNRLISNIMLDNIELKTLTAEEADYIITPTGVKYADGKLSGVSVSSERLQDSDEKMLAAVYSDSNGSLLLKGVAECASVSSLTQTEAALKNSLDVAVGDKVKIFFWNMSKLIPQSYFETTVE